MSVSLRRAMALSLLVSMPFSLLGLPIATGCAGRKAMRQQAVVIASSAEGLDDDLSRLDGALDTVHRLRRVRIEGDRLSADRSARETEILLGVWRLEDDPLSRAKVGVFEGVRGASDAAAAHGYGVIDYKIGVERSVPGYNLDRAAARRLVNLLLRLAKPTSFRGEAGFFINYAITVGEGAKQGVDQVVMMVNEHNPAPGHPGGDKAGPKSGDGPGDKPADNSGDGPSENSGDKPSDKPGD